MPTKRNYMKPRVIISLTVNDLLYGKHKRISWYYFDPMIKNITRFERG